MTGEQSQTEPFSGACPTIPIVGAAIGRPAAGIRYSPESDANTDPVTARTSDARPYCINDVFFALHFCSLRLDNTKGSVGKLNKMKVKKL